MVAGRQARDDVRARGGGAIGRSVLRSEDRPLLTGRGCFVDDVHRDGAVHAAILRSPYAHARIASIDASAVRADPHVLDVVTSAELPPEVRIPIRMFPLDGMEQLLQPPLAAGIVRYSGEPVAVVVADSRYAAEDALARIDVGYEPLEPVLDTGTVLEPTAPIVHEAAGSNLAAEIHIRSGDIDEAFADADLVVEEQLSCQRHGAVPLEPRGLVAELDPRTGRLTVWGAAKVVHANRRILAALLGWSEDRVHLVELDVGGGFGGRGEFYPEDFLIPACALRLRGRPVAWTEDREENLRALNHSREQLHTIALGVRADGTLLALRDRFLMNTGAYVRTHGSVVPGMTAGLLPGPYRWRAYDCRALQVISNKTPAGTYRAPGRYEANFVRERMIDLVAHRLGRDPVDLRRQNLLEAGEMPYEVGTHTDGHPVVFDSGDFPLLLDKGLASFSIDEMRQWRDENPGPRLRRGIGVSFFVEKSGIARWEYARVGIAGNGRAIAHVGSASVGQGMRTVLAQVCADALGVPYDHVEVRHGDTDDVPEGMGAFGSRATTLGGSAVARAGAALRERLLRLAAEALEASTTDLEIAGDRVVVRGSPSIGVPLAQLATPARGGEALARSQSPDLEEVAYFDCADMNFPYGLHCVALQVDLDTGGVDIHRYAVTYDVGRAVNPLLVDGQIVGGVAQGLGGALLEEFAYDAGGQLVTGSFMDYLLPTAGEMPAVRVRITEDAPTPLNPLGVKGAGEGGTAAAGAAIANALSDALHAEVTELPLTPERVLELAARVGSEHACPSCQSSSTLESA